MLEIIKFVAVWSTYLSTYPIKLHVFLSFMFAYSVLMYSIILNAITFIIIHV